MSDAARSATGTSGTTTNQGTPVRNEKAQNQKAQVFAATRDWPNYFRAMAGKGPRETLVSALDRFDREEGFARNGDGDAIAARGASRGLAIDLGCGEGRDTVELLRRGWRVRAIDGHPMGLDLLRARIAAGEVASDAPSVEYVLAAMEDAPLPTCRLLNASFSLPFCAPARFGELWRRVVASIEPGGRFSGQLFGDRDEWATLADRSHQSRGELDVLFAGFLLEELREEERDSPDAEGRAKHWHVFHIVARKLGER